MKKIISRFLVIISLVGILIPSSFASAATPIATFNGLGGSQYYIYSSIYIGYGYQTSGTEVEVLQAALNENGYNPGIIDGKFGNNTLRALNNFQDRYFGSHDGIAGPQTFRKLRDLCDAKGIILPINPL